ncbi:MAG: TetR/AcrR family transcriptional regulator [Oceanipulchritudo sp.]
MKAPARERILQTAGDLFTRRGYGNVGINEIIERSGTAKASFYQHFKSKDALCLEWLNSWHCKTEKECESILAQPGSAEKKILNFFEALGEFLEAGDFRGCPFTNTASFLVAESNPAIRVAIKTHKAYQHQFLVSLAEELTTPARAKKLGTALFLLYSGATMEGQNLRDTWPVDAARGAVRELCRAYSRQGLAQA